MNRHYNPDAELKSFIVSLPKAERHLHLEGSISFDQLHEFDPERYPTPPAFWDPDFRFDSFNHFQSLFDEWIVPYHSDIARYQETARRVFANCVAQGCRYVETSFHIPAIHWMGVDGPDLLAAIKQAAPANLEVRLFGGMTHEDLGVHQELLEAALHWEDLAGIDLHGPEDLPVDAGVPAYWRRARELGKVTKAHAGEFMPASFVQWAIQALQVSRIQHGVRAIESSQVVQELIAKDIALDVCPISNLKLAVEGVTDMTVHPIRRLYDAGVTVTINTDDTFMFGNRLEEEYCALVEDLQFSRLELIQLARNGFKDALLDADQQRRIADELDAIAESC